MAFEQLAKHVNALGGVRRIGGGELQPLDDAELRALENVVGAPLPGALRWWFSTYGGGVEFVEPVVYTDPDEHVEVLLGHFLDAGEVRQTIGDLEGTLSAHRIPINDDASGNFLVVDSGGAVLEHVHDAPVGRNVRHIADSFEQFVRMLRPGE